jgi:hypothetical protein
VANNSRSAAAGFTAEQPFSAIANMMGNNNGLP